MNVGQLKAILARFPDDHLIIGQYRDSSDAWPIGQVEVAKVPGRNTMVVVQVLIPEPDRKNRAQGPS